ncbi:MAG: Peptidase S15 [Thermotogales bacterium 46_20]|nr:MAG: Peptidase S15 [Thermotogales bacterium 46_20]
MKKTSKEPTKSDKRRIRARVKVAGRIVVLVILVVVGALTSWALSLALVIAMNARVLWEAAFGRLPLQVDRDSFVGPITHEYTSSDKKLNMDLYYPAKSRATNGERYPLVLFTHGGGWIGGSRKQTRNVSWCELLASRGVAVASIDYRLAFTSEISDIMGDYSNALEFLRNNASSLKIDTDRVVLMGLSAGGHLSLLFACRNSFENNVNAMKGIRGVVAWYAPCDLMDIWSEDNESLFARIGSTLAVGGPPSQREEDYRKHSPINWVSGRMVPTFLVHGAKDQVVPIVSSLKMYRKLKQEGVQVHLKIEVEGRHGFEIERKSSRTIKYIEQTVAFIKRQFIQRLRGEE